MLMDSPRDILIETLRDVEDGDVPEDLRGIAFEKVFELRAGTLRSGESASAGGVAGVGTPVSAARAELDAGGDPVARIAQRLGLGAETVGEVFDVHEGEVELIIPAGKLPNRPATGTKQIALLVAGGRQAAGTEDWTSIDVIRQACSYFRRLDSPNFAKTIKEMDDVLNFRNPSPRKIQVRLARPGWEQLADDVRRLGGE
jgi:hypothetical protein